MTFVPPTSLFRMSYPCYRVEKIPRTRAAKLLDLPTLCQLEDLSPMDERKSFADVRMAWNELGIGLQVEVSGKEQAPQGEANRVKGSDGVTLWLDTRDSRTSHRGSRYCHQFHFLPTGGGENQDEPHFAQSKIHRALHDALIASADAVAFRCSRQSDGYFLEAFLPASVLNGFDPEQNPRLGFFYVVRDLELGEQLLSHGPEFPFWENPSLWSVLELVQ